MVSPPKTICSKTPRVGLLLWKDEWQCKRTDEQDELPALVFGHAPLEGRHGFSALADLVEERAVGDGVHVLGVCEIGWFRIVAHGFGAVALAAFAMAIGAVFRV